jgi:uncharacterized repeat protein (TIGR01451 family)
MTAGTIVNTATATGLSPNNTPVTDTDNETVTAIRADLAVVKTGTPPSVIAGNNITYTIVVTNNGPFTAQNVLMEDVLGPNLTILSGTPSEGTWNEPDWTIPSLANGASATLTLVAEVSASLFNGATVTNTATVSSETFDHVPSNNTSTATNNVITLADVAVTKVGSPDPVTAGEVLTYTITINNLGPSDAQNVLLSDLVPAIITSPEYSINGGVSWLPWTTFYAAGLIPAGDSRTVLLRGTVQANAPHGGTIMNAATVISSTTDPDPTNNTDVETTGIVREADLAITKTHIDPLSLPSIVAGKSHRKCWREHLYIMCFR